MPTRITRRQSLPSGFISCHDRSMASRRRPTDADYHQLLELRTTLRRFLRWSADQAEEAGLTAAQHQLLLAVRGHGGAAAGPTIGELADYLLLRHHGAVQL